ncbi:hypothetical protein C1646_770083 [Rhizophagus diaphanus]|nr:hypothetical protein C1646_770083 [Rhizophagus diaphanus] [Rhizophagus sp. MUCL 43196]
MPKAFNVRELIVKICASLRREKLSNACKNNDINNLKSILDVSTRWNSTFDMIKRALQLKVVIDYIEDIIGNDEEDKEENEEENNEENNEKNNEKNDGENDDDEKWN